MTKQLLTSERKVNNTGGKKESSTHFKFTISYEQRMSGSQRIIFQLSSIFKTADDPC